MTVLPFRGRGFLTTPYRSRLDVSAISVCPASEDDERKVDEARVPIWVAYEFNPLMSTVAVMPAERITPGGTSSIWMRTGMRWARLTQVKVGLTVATP